MTEPRTKAGRRLLRIFGLNPPPQVVSMILAVEAEAAATTDSPDDFRAAVERDRAALSPTAEPAETER